MKPDTKVWLRCESIGRPADTITIQTSIRGAIKVAAEWLLTAYMGQKIRLTLARTEEELEGNRRTSNVQQMMQELDSILDGSDFAHDSGIDRESQDEPS